MFGKFVSPVVRSVGVRGGSVVSPVIRGLMVLGGNVVIPIIHGLVSSWWQCGISYHSW